MNHEGHVSSWTTAERSGHGTPLRRRIPIRVVLALSTIIVAFATASGSGTSPSSGGPTSKGGGPGTGGSTAGSGGVASPTRTTRP